MWNALAKVKAFLFFANQPQYSKWNLDEWGDEGHWETLDLRDENGEGMPMEEFSAMLKKSIADDEQKSKISKKVKSKRES